MDALLSPGPDPHRGRRQVHQGAVERAGSARDLPGHRARDHAGQLLLQRHQGVLLRPGAPRPAPEPVVLLQEEVSQQVQGAAQGQGGGEHLQYSEAVLRAA